MIIDGKSLANNIVMIGGKIQAQQVFNPATMQLYQDGSFALFSQLGFTGATGGTFTVNCNQNKTVVTAPIAWNAAASDILAAINTALGHSDACFTVTGTATGGPWKIVPGNNGAVGRCSINIAGLTGSPVLSAVTYTYNGTISALWVKNWLGCFHIEGVWVDNTFGADAFDASTPYSTASLQLVNNHFHSQCEPFHNDWVHPDGTQAYLGPAKLYAQNCDFVTKGGNGFIGQPRHTSSPSALQALWDWWFMNCQTREFDNSDQQYPQAADGGLSAGGGFYVESDYPSLGGNGGYWNYVMTACFSNKWNSASGTQILTRPTQELVSDYQLGPPTSYKIPNGLSINAVPASNWMCDPALGQCGLGYTTIGYQNIGQPVTTQRFSGTTALTTGF